ncbi:MAG: RluA family pseudouridine synthase [Opitutaceae bacterium]|jgi:23S rRNA-/tRNA-specific pseudouridylate synthase
MPIPPVIYEDDTLIAFNKPSGMLVAPDRWDKARENLMGLVHDKMGHGVANVHRLDADTSGILLCTKEKSALDFVSGQFQSKTVAKIYHALCVGTPTPELFVRSEDPDDAPPVALGADDFFVDRNLVEDENQPGRMRAVRKLGKSSQTVVKVLERFQQFTFVQCSPLTGRTHQLRVHLQYCGLPILNDPFYGDGVTELKLSNLKRGYKGRIDEKPLITRLALHASRLTIKHPITKQPVTIDAPLPNEFEVALKYLRKFAAVK